MSKIVKNELGYLGVDFQYRLINAFFEDPDFFSDLYSVIDQNVFTDAHLKTIVGVLKEYYAKYNAVPSYSIMQYNLNDKAYNEDEIQFYQETLDRIRKIGTEGIEDVENLSEKFFKQQNWVRVANEILRIAGDGDVSKYDDCQRLMEEAMSVGRNQTKVSCPYDNIDSDLSSADAQSIPTGISRLDEILVGGLDKGKVGVIIGSSSFGKTSMTTCIAANAATTKTEDNFFEGYKVLQIVFEDEVRDINRKHFSKISQVETCKINSSKEVTEYVRNAVINNPDGYLIKNNLRIMRLGTGEKTASDIVKEIKALRNQGFNADLVIVDYFECVKGEKGTRTMSRWEQEEKTMRVFENAAHELDVAMWIPLQGNRDSINSELVTMDKAGGALQKIQIAQVVISITRSLDDIKEQLATIAVLKNRSGSAGIVLNSIGFNNGTCTIDCSKMDESDDVVDFNARVAKREKDIEKQLKSKLLNQ